MRRREVDWAGYGCFLSEKEKGVKGSCYRLNRISSRIRVTLPYD